MIRKRLNGKLFLSLVIFSVVLWCRVTHATTMKGLSMAKLVDKSSLIVEGRVSQISSMWNENRTMIVTHIDITLTSNALIKGELADTLIKGELKNKKITLKLLGGSVDGITTVVLGNPLFVLDEQVLLFLHPGRGKEFQGFSRIIGRAQGKYRVENGVAKRNLENISFVGEHKPPEKEEIPLANLKRDLNLEVQRQEQEELQEQEQK